MFIYYVHIYVSSPFKLYLKFLGAEDERVQERRRPERRVLSGIKPWMQIPMNVPLTAMIHYVLNLDVGTDSVPHNRSTASTRSSLSTLRAQPSASNTRRSRSMESEFQNPNLFWWFWPSTIFSWQSCNLATDHIPKRHRIAGPFDRCAPREDLPNWCPIRVRFF